MFLLSVAFAQPLPEIEVAGTISFEKVPANREGLQPEAKYLQPASGVVVELVTSAEPRRILAQTTTRPDGTYSLRVRNQGRQRVYVRALTQSGAARVIGVHNSKLYGVRTPESFILNGPRIVKDVIALYDEGNRAAGAFNILATIGRATATLGNSRRLLNIKKIDVRWDLLYSGQTYYDTRSGSIFVRGKRDEDSDEFDDCVILHEYAHHLAAQFLNQSGIGGAHSPGDELDPRVAWTEGLANFLTAMVLGDPLLVDTNGIEGKNVFTMDLEPNFSGYGEKPGSSSEHTVGSILWDLACQTPGDPPYDHLQLGLQPLWAIGSDAFRSEPFPDLTSFLNLLLKFDPKVADRAARLFPERGLEFGEGQSIVNAFFTTLPVDVPVAGKVDSATKKLRNSTTASRFYVLVVLRPGIYRINLKILGATSTTPLTLRLLHKGVRVPPTVASAAAAPAATVQIAERLGAGAHVIEVRSWDVSDKGIERFSAADYEVEATAGTP